MVPRVDSLSLLITRLLKTNQILTATRGVCCRTPTIPGAFQDVLDGLAEPYEGRICSTLVGVRGLQKQKTGTR